AALRGEGAESLAPSEGVLLGIRGGDLHGIPRAQALHLREHRFPECVGVRRIAQSCAERLRPAIERVDREEVRQAGAVRDVRVDVEHDVDARRARGLDQPERLVRLPPVALPLRLQVGDLDGHASALTDADGLLDRGQKPVILSAYVAIVQAPGVPQWRVSSRPEERPQAHPAMASSTSARMRAVSSTVAGRSSAPTTKARILPAPTMLAMLSAAPSRSTCARKPATSRNWSSTPSRRYRSRTASNWSSDQSPTELPSCPATSVVTPCSSLLSARGFVSTCVLVCEWMSTKPGESARPSSCTSSAPAALRPRPISRIRPSATSTSASSGAAPVPSYTTAPRRRSAARPDSAGAPRTKAGPSVAAPRAAPVWRRKVRRFIMNGSRQLHVRPASFRAGAPGRGHPMSATTGIDTRRSPSAATVREKIPVVIVDEHSDFARIIANRVA